ncbi:MAG: AIR synthase-related protein, partial [Planctomycetota bacterium]
GTPFISGKDSLNNEYRVGDETLAIPPTLLITAMGQVPDVARAVSTDFKRAGNLLYQVGSTCAELGGSHYHEWLGVKGGSVPRPNLELAPVLFRVLHKALAKGLVRACHDLAEGGLAVALAEMAIGGDLGAELDVSALPLEGFKENYDLDAVALFSESCTRFVVEVEPQQVEAFEAALQWQPFTRLGVVSADRRLRIRGHAGALIDLDLDALRRAHQGTFHG